MADEKHDDQQAAELEAMSRLYLAMGVIEGTVYRGPHYDIVYLPDDRHYRIYSHEDRGQPVAIFSTPDAVAKFFRQWVDND